ncbi:MAG: SAM-dependent methyltransferase [Hyphomicrobiales bacterium]|nr:MAG: SAM-dependent methyltransferase [Hyphomicrobiales bacterium]
MNQIPNLFDHTLLAARRKRAAQNPAAMADANFLRQAGIADLTERLGAVSKKFENGLELDAPDDFLCIKMRESGRVQNMARGGGFLQAALDHPQSEDGTALYTGGTPFPAYDLITSVLSLQFSNDLPGTLIQIRNGLKPDGLFLGVLLGGDTLIELRQVLLQAEAEIRGGASPRVSPFGEVRDMGSLLQRAGFALPVTDVDTLTVRYANPMRLLSDLRAMGATNVLVSGATQPLRRDVLMRAMELYREQFAHEDGKVPATFQLISLSGWAPHESQQKPLKPGSAKTRLADALGVKEFGNDMGRNR